MSQPAEVMPATCPHPAAQQVPWRMEPTRGWGAAVPEAPVCCVRLCRGCGVTLVDEAKSEGESDERHAES